MDTSIYYSAVIPVFNESRNIKPLYDRLKKALAQLDGASEIIFVDDGSSDDSFEILKEIAFSDKSVNVLRFAKNFGQHNAVVAGIRQARGEYVITLDSDLQNPPEEIPVLVRKLKEGYDMVSGYRRVRKDTFTRRATSFVTNMIIAALTGLRMKDYGSMLRVFKADVAKKTAEIFAKNHGYITMLVAKVSRNVAEIEVSHEERYSGKSKYTFGRLITTFFRIFCYNDMIAAIFLKQKGPLYIIKEKIEHGKTSSIAG